MLRLSSTTHAFNMSQYINELTLVSQTTEGLNVRAPAAPATATPATVAPPGYYLLFILNGSGVPSVAKFVQLVGTAPSPLPDVVVTSLSYASGVFTSTVKNQGTVATPSGIFIGVGYSVDGVYRTWGGSSTPLAAGASVTIGTDGGPYTIPTGTHTIMAYVDDVNRFAESDETNNQLSQSITVGGAPDTTPPTVPTGLTAVVSASQVSLSWNASTDNVGVTGYRVYRNGTQIAAPASNSYIDSNLARYL